MHHLPPRVKLTIAPKHLAIVILPVLVVTLSESLLSIFADTSVSLDPLSLIPDMQLTELVGRYRFLAVFFFYAAVCLAIFALFAAELLSRHSRKSILRVILGLVALIVFSFLFSMVEPEWMGSFEAYELLGASLFEEGLRAGGSPLCDVGGCDDKGAFFTMRFLMGATNILSAFAVPAVILGMIVALSRPGDIDLTTPKGVLAEGRTLQTARAAVRRYLYLSGALLSAGMMLGYAWMMWPAELLADPEQSAQYQSLVQSISLYRGVSYTVLILSFYMPVSLIQMVRIERFHDAAHREDMEVITEQAEALEIDKIQTLDALKAILSILAPILAAAVGSFVGIDALAF